MRRAKAGLFLRTACVLAACLVAQLANGPGVLAQTVPDPPQLVTTAAIDAEYLDAYTIASAKDAKKFALVVGNSAYRDIPALANAANDARAIAATLRGLGFRVELLVDIPRRALIEAVERLSREAVSTDVALFFYAGHAAEVGGANYMFGIDIPQVANERDLIRTGVPTQQVLSLIEQSAPIRVLVLDACRDNPFGALAERGGVTRQVLPELSGPVSALEPQRVKRAGLGAMRGRSGTYIAYSAEPGKIASDGEPGEPNSPFTAALIKHAVRAGLTIEQIFNEVRREVLIKQRGQQLPWSESALLGSLYLQPPPPATAVALPGSGPAADTRTLVSDGELAKLLAAGPFEIAGKTNVKARLAGDAVVLADGSDSSEVLTRGVNYITMGKDTVPAWYERRQLVLFPRTYKKSYAVIAAVGTYPEAVKDRYKSLEFMVPQAEKLADLLTGLGFSKENIVTLFDKDASSKRIEDELRRFWPGGDRADADRVLFYFGGHGNFVDLPNYLTYVKDQTSKRGIMVTHDHDPQRPLSTSFLLDDIIQRHFAFLAPRHVLFLVDACSSGLALPRMAGPTETAADNVLRYQQLALLDAELKGHARNLLVASTGTADALYNNGGLFTRVLIEAIESRAADVNGDGIIQFNELDLHVSNQVMVRSKSSGYEQSPSSYKVGSNFVLMLPPAK